MITDLGERLEQAQTRKGLTGVQLARRAGYTPAAISRLKHGETPRFQTLIDIAQTLEVEPAWLTFGVGPMTRNQTQ